MAVPNWSNDVLDGGLDFFTAGNVTRVDICAVEPANYAAIASLANYTLVGGDFTKAAGDTSGRKVTLGAKSGSLATADGAGNFLVFSNGTDTMYGAINGDGDAIVTNQQVNVAAVDVYEVRAPINNP